ncbi:MAG: Holliday junction resolvase RuvX [Atopobiaceae bacterium]|nr:Holliday junction resolvase RuvX [Atopobiaceae bacterium]
MRAMALDIGQRRVGVAVSDAQGRIAQPVCVMDAQEVLNCGKTFKRLIEDWEPAILVCGRPKSLSGEDGQQSERIMQIATKIAETCELPLSFQDERLSSSEAKRLLREQGLSEKDMRGKVDMVAASLFLQTWLDTRQVGKEDDGTVF